LSGCYDEADVVPATHAVEASSYWLQATPTLDEPFTQRAKGKLSSSRIGN